MALLAVLVGLFTWRGSSLFWGVAFFSAFIRTLTLKNYNLARDYSYAFGGASLLVSLYCLVDPWGNASGVTFSVISWFHAICLAAFSVIMFCLRWWQNKKIRKLVLFTVFGVFLVSFAVDPFRDFWKQILGGFSFIRGEGDTWLEINSEFNGVFSSGRNFWFCATYLTPFWFLIPGIVIFGTRKWLRLNQKDPLLLNFR